MAERSWMVGSLPDCDIRVENSAVSGRHCRLTQRGESLLLEDLDSTNGTFVAGERVSGPRIVRRGDPVTLGRNTPLPWPPVIRSVTIGRLPDNDIVIPLDMISGQHARLEQEGDTVYLIDLGSKNGTAVNDPLNKIPRAAIQPTDHVFFGTHRVAAWELLKTLPKHVERHATALEAGASTDLERELSSAGGDDERSQRAELSPWERFGTRSSWAWGVGLSALCATVILGAPWILRSGDQQIGDAATPPEHRDAAPANTKHDTKPTDEPPPGKSTPSQNRVAPPAMPPAPQESVVRRSEEALALVGIRAGDVVVITTATVWACGPDTVVCPTSILDSLESNLDKYKGIAKYKGLDATLVVCTPHKTLAILEHRPGNGAAEGFSLAKLEAPLDAVCTTAASDPPLQPDQPLTMLTCWCEQKDKPGTIARNLHRLKIERIERSADKSPLLLHCSGEAISGDVQGSPVFDATGSVVGCARPSAGEVAVVPVARLVELFPAKQ